MKRFYKILLFYPIVIPLVFMALFALYDFTVFRIAFTFPSLDFLADKNVNDVPNLFYFMPFFLPINIYLHSFMIPLVVFHLIFRFVWKNQSNRMGLKFYIISIAYQVLIFGYFDNYDLIFILIVAIGAIILQLPSLGLFKLLLRQARKAT